MTVRVEFQKEMHELHEQIIRMGAAVEQAIGRAVEALITLDVKLAQEVIDGDDMIDEMEREIDRKCISLIALQQPVARDLRDVTSNLKLITDLERIADHATDICKLVQDIAESKYELIVPHDVVVLADMTRAMIKAALDSYVSRDRAQAEKTIRMDRSINNVYHQLKRYLVHQMEVDKAHVASLADLLMIAKYFERAGDHAQNVAEWVIYYIDGRHVVYEEEERLHAEQSGHSS
jgi:phosphate transport system protein